MSTGDPIVVRFGIGRQDTSQRVGVRAYADVEQAHKDLAAPPEEQRSPQFRGGAAAAYQWALARSDHSPITGTNAHGVPDLRLLTAEVDAAAVQLDDTTNQGGTREYIHGAHDALAWVCGYSDHRA